MSSRYFIGGGTTTSPAAYNNTANWSETDGGTGGVTVPTAADDRYFNSDAVVTGIPNSHSAATVIGTNAQVQWNQTGSITLSGSLLVSENAGFTLTGNYTLTFDNDASAVIQKNAVMTKPQSNIAFRGQSILNNKGILSGLVMIAPAQVHEPGTVSQLIIQTWGAAADVHLGNDLPVNADSVTIQHSQNYSVSAVLRTPLIVHNIELYAAANAGLHVVQKNAVRISGNVTAAGTAIHNNTFTWQTDAGAVSYFTGSANQSITFPQWVSGHNWIADKTDGTLELAAFNGFLQGRCKNLIVRAGSSIDLSAAPAVLDAVSPNGTAFQAAYYGIKANSTYPFGSVLSQDEICEREALDSVLNFGSIHIPAGRVLCTKSLTNNTGAVITGEGMLCVEHGGLINSGMIAGSVKIWFFNEPKAAAPMFEIPASKKEAGIPRNNVPSFYRLTLAFGEDYMTDTIRLFTAADKYGRALSNGSGLFLARISHSDGSPILPEELSCASYSIYRLDKNDPVNRLPVEGHSNIPLSIAGTVLRYYALDANWEFDTTGYNFRCLLMDSVSISGVYYSPFPLPEENYLVVFELVPVGSVPKIQLQYRVHRFSPKSAVSLFSLLVFRPSCEIVILFPEVFIHGGSYEITS
ncbi:MAG: hypothetical protein FWE67_16470, partial [Planctomycetaceae bacterium]|nr:hypothetical protein [Planctomycetaceae bacterium]